eukprot:CCRYP_000433-RA/>CCRYP_000433-RA protein AED:0.02 eAED:0.02 QI:325/1/1/1/1/1/5/149/3140
MSQAQPPTPKASTLSPLDSPSSYVNASKQDKAAIKAAYSEIFRIPKKKRRVNSDADGGDNAANAGHGGGAAPSLPDLSRSKSAAIATARGDDDANVAAKVEPETAASSETSTCPTKCKSPSKTKDCDDRGDANSILRKGDLVRLDSEQTRSGRIQGGLARIYRTHPPPTDGSASEYRYDIEYVLGGKVFNIPRQELLYTTAEAEGLVSSNLRERRGSRSRNGQEEEDKKTSPPNKRKRDCANKKPASIDGSVCSRNSRSRTPAAKKTNKEEETVKSNKTSKLAPRRTSRRTSTDDDASDVVNASTNNDSRAMDMYVRHKRELERSLARLEKVDRFGFFFDSCPPEFDENYDAVDAEEEFLFPDTPPFNLVVLRKRFEAGRYDLDMVKAEVKRRTEIRDIMTADAKVHLNETMGETVKQTIKEEPSEMDSQTDDGNGTHSNDNHDNTCLYGEVARTMRHPIGVDWDTFNSDVIRMCDAAINRDPEGVELGSGHLGFAANKIKKVMEEMYTNYGCKRRSEMEASEARHKYESILKNCGNREAAMQGKWRKHAFPERKYERLETASVICDGLSEMDKSYAIYELGTSIPDSFVGLAYTYDDSGQHSETWMKTVVDETTAKPKSKRRKKDVDDAAAPTENDKNNEHTAALALANDDGVVKTQVHSTMQALLIQVQDRVMTDLGVMHQPEARSANWDDGDHRRNYRGGSAEVEQGSKFMTLPEVAEQEVWGVDCYTRKNIMALIESEFSPEIAVEFMEKWLLPAINACPVDLAHNIATAARILEGLPLVGSDEKENTTSKPDLNNDSRPEKDVETSMTDEPHPALHNNFPQRRKAPESSVFLRNALESKINHFGPPWLKAAARLLRLAADSLDEDDGFFRIYPKGHGSVVISEQGLKANSLVTYYRGEVYPAWRWCEKLDAIEKTQKDLGLRPNLPDFYNMAMERPKKDPRGYGILFVDASRKSGLGSSFSHSCNPSCEVRVVALNGKLSLSMTTLRDLEQGEELTFDYNAVTESLNEYRFAVCLCGHRKCRGSFLHLTSAPCYQQVLSRNCPIASRFANLVRGCMKKVMSREDSELLLKHGFNTAAFGAVSFNHHCKANRSVLADTATNDDREMRVQLGELLLQLSSSSPRISKSQPLATREVSDAVISASSSNNIIPDSSEDSIENVPIWLRTYVADTLRYIEYERRALPVALLCNQMERKEQHQKKEKRCKDKEKKNVSDSEKLSPSPADLSNSEKSRSVVGSKPTSSYFFYLHNNRERFTSVVQQEQGNELTGLALSQAVNKEASLAWSNLSDEEKQSWKKKAIADWEKNGGKEKAKLEEERQRTIEPKGPKRPKEEDRGDSDDDPPLCNNDHRVEEKEISFADAEAEGLTAMEQRIQQLAQSLSRVGRVLDRHRETECAKTEDTTVNAEFLRSLVPTPLKIMSDEEVVNWMWNDPKGVVHNLFSVVDLHFPKESLLHKLLSNTRSTYPVLSAFTEFSQTIMHPSVESKKGKNACTIEDARRLVREALLEFRSDIKDFLSFAETSHFDAIKKKKKEAERRRNADKNAKKQMKCKQTTDESDGGGEETLCSEVVALSDSKGGDSPTPKNETEPQTEECPDIRDEMSIDGSHVSDKVIRIRGGGEGVMCSESNPSLTGVSSATIQAVDDNNSLAMLQSELPRPNDHSASSQNRDSSLFQPTSSLINEPPDQKLGSKTDDSMDDSKFKLHVRPDILSEDRKSVITPSSTESREETKCSGLTASFRVPDDTTSGLLEEASNDRVSCSDRFDGKPVDPTGINHDTRQGKPSTCNALLVDPPADEGQQQQQLVSRGNNSIHEMPNQSEVANTTHLSADLKGISLKAATVEQDAQNSSIGSVVMSIPRSSDEGPERVEPINEPTPDKIPEVARSGDGSITLSCTVPDQEFKKKKTNPMNQKQLTYLKNWLLNPNHILNPYPTDAEKDKIMTEIGVDRAQLDRWLSRHRKPFICSPEKQQVKMNWREIDSSHWTNFRRQRYMLEATADLLLMYASTHTFFLLEPFTQFDSTPIEVYARELGNEVPRHLASSDENNSEKVHNRLDAGEQCHVGNVDDKARAASSMPVRGALNGQTDEFCSPEDVITSVTVSYSGEYVLSQLLQWFNGGIGQNSGLPDIFGCIMLPPISGCWDDIKDVEEIKIPTYTRANPLTVTEYNAKIRLRLADWMDDRTKRGSPWTEDLARYFCRIGSSPDPSMPMGSPVVDYLVTGIDENIKYVSSVLRESDDKGIDSPARSRSKTSASDRLQSTVDAGMPAQAVANWVQCENPKCLKWRKLPWHVDIDLLPEKFFCKDNIWTPGKKTCDAPEDKWDMSDAPIKFDTVEDDFEIGVWFDVQRDGKIGYHEAQVVATDFNSTIKRVKFHFWRLKNASDEWVEVGSPRIAPHHSYTPRPVEGYGVPKRNKKKNTDRSKKDGSSDENNMLDSKKRKSEEALPEQTKKPPETADSSKTDSHKKSKLHEKPEPPTKATPLSENANSCKKFVPFPKSIVEYLNDWFTKHSSYPFPSLDEKATIMSATGLNKRQLSDWLAKARKKQKKRAGLSSENPDEVGATSDAKSNVPKANAESEKLEDLLLQLKGYTPLASQSSGDLMTGTTDGDNVSSVIQETVTEVISEAIPSRNPLKSSMKPTASDSPNKSANLGLSDEAKSYLWKWIQTHKSNPFPSKAEKEKMMADLGLGHDEIRKLEGWFSRTRKRLKKENGTGIDLAVNSDTISCQSQNPSENNETQLQANIIPDKIKDNKPSANSQNKSPTKPTSGEVDAYLNEWLTRPENAMNFNPNQEAREKIEAETGIEKRRVESWFYRLRKKMKKQEAALNGVQSSQFAVKTPSSVNTSEVSTKQHVAGPAPASKPNVLNSSTSAVATEPEIKQSSTKNGAQMGQVQGQATSVGLSNLDALLEAASIHSAAKEACNRMESQAIASPNDSSSCHNTPHFNESFHKPRYSLNPSSIDATMFPSERISGSMQAGNMRFPTIAPDQRTCPSSYHFCQSVENDDPRSRSSYHDEPFGCPPSSFAPICSTTKESSTDQQFQSSPGSIPVFNTTLHPAYNIQDKPYRRMSPTFASAPHNDSHQGPSPHYIPANTSHPPAHPNISHHSYPRQPREHNYRIENAHYNSEYPSRYNVHTGQHYGSQP